MSKVKQTERILRHLEERGSITTLEAITEHGVLRLASRINDLRRAGHKIISTYVTGKNRYGETVRFSVYTLKKEDKNNGI